MSADRPIFQTAKDVRKAVRSVIQLLILAFLVYHLAGALLNVAVYRPYYPGEHQGDQGDQGDQGFIAISYPGITRKGGALTLSTERLEAQLEALSAAGYVTVEQQDIIDYYAGLKDLPAKSLLLLFGDGKRETRIFAQKILEKYNYKATMLTFADSFAAKNGELLSPKDMAAMEESNFWEQGSHGYRTYYINVFDEEGNYWGEMPPQQFDALGKLVGNNFDYYLMDYVRDNRGLPKESYEEMARRVEGDYALLAEAYQGEIGQVPRLYALLAPNSGAYGCNSKTSQVNEKCIKTLFAMNLNRQGQALNNRDNSIYDLTRIQAETYWRTNHLLMRVHTDTGQEIPFVSGDKAKAALGQTLLGGAEFSADEIILTTLADGGALLRLLTGEHQNFALSLGLEGNKYGNQAILLRMDEALANGISVAVKDNVLYIHELNQGEEQLLYTLSLDVLDGRPVRGHVPAISEAGSRQMHIVLNKERLSVSIDGKIAAEQILVEKVSSGSILLKAETSALSSQSKMPLDNIYDGVFKGLLITTLDKKTIIFDSRLKGVEMIIYKGRVIGKGITDWFIENL